MKSINRNLTFLAVAMLTLMLGTASVSVFGQEDAKGKAMAEKAGHKSENKEHGFCTSSNWSNGDRVSFNELREMTVVSTGSLNVDGRQNGGVNVKGEDRSDVLIRACVQAWGKTDDVAKSLAANVRIGTAGSVKAENSDSDNNWSVSYEIRVPRSTNLNLTAHNGGVSISNVDGTAEFETQNGGVFLSNVSGAYKGRTTNGGVFVKLAGTSWKGSGLDVTTTNGGVNIEMPANFAAHVETGTVNGGFNSNIPGLEMPKKDEYGRRTSSRISTDINGGGAPIRVITTNGGVRISTGSEKD